MFRLVVVLVLISPLSPSDSVISYIILSFLYVVDFISFLIGLGFVFHNCSINDWYIETIKLALCDDTHFTNSDLMFLQLLLDTFTALMRALHLFIIFRITLRRQARV